MLIIMGEHYRTIVDLRSSQMLKVPASPPLAGKLQQQYIVKKQQREILTLAGSERREYSTVTIPTLKFGKEPCYHVKTYIEDKADDYLTVGTPFFKNKVFCIDNTTQSYAIQK